MLEPLNPTTFRQHADVYAQPDCSTHEYTHKTVCDEYQEQTKSNEAFYTLPLNQIEWTKFYEKINV